MSSKPMRRACGFGSKLKKTLIRRFKVWGFEVVITVITHYFVGSGGLQKIPKPHAHPVVYGWGWSLHSRPSYANYTCVRGWITGGWLAFFGLAWTMMDTFAVATPVTLYQLSDHEPPSPPPDSAPCPCALEVLLRGSGGLSKYVSE